MSAIRHPLLCLFVALTVATVAGASAKEPAKPAPAAAAAATKIKFSGVEYLHRWSQNGQNEFTPAAQPDLKSWREMVTVNVNERVTNGDQLAAMANAVLGNYQKAGEIVRTDSKPRTSTSEAEHFIAAMLHAKGVSEAVFARVMMVEGKGVVVVFSHRAYGANSTQAIGAWMTSNGEATERALRSWTGVPKIAQLRALPQAGPG
jgi:hypothetical protein